MSSGSLKVKVKKNTNNLVYVSYLLKASIKVMTNGIYLVFV